MKRFSILLLLALLLQAGAAPAFGDSESSRLARKAKKAQASKDFTEAYLLYTRASTLDPGNKGYLNKIAQLRAKVTPSSPTVVVSTPEVDIATVFDNLDSLPKFRGNTELQARPGRLDINLQGDFKTLYQQLTSIYQLDCVFDSDYEPGRAFHFVIGQADYREALNALAAATNSFMVPIAPKVIIVARDTPQKRTDLEQAMSVTVPIPQYISVQELVEIAQAVRQATGVEKLSWDNKTGSVIMRDRVSRVLPAQKLFYNLFSYRPEVMIDLQLIEITRSDIINYGINLPNAFNIAFTGQSTTTTGSSSSSLLASNTPNPFPFNSLSYIFTVLSSQGGASVAQAVVRGLFPTSLSVFSIGLGEANALVNFSNSLGKTILTQNLRSVDAQPATFHYGQKYPILTGTYGAGATVGAQYLPVPSFTYEDLGVSLKVTPHVHGMDAVSLDVESEFKLLSGASVNGNPIISNRKLKAIVNLENNEWAVVAGLQQNMDSSTVAGTVGLSSVPVLSQIFSQRRKEKDRSEILILMRPHLLSLPGNQSVPKDVRVGSETRPFIPL